MPRIANRNAREYVLNREPFRGSHLFAKWLNPAIYVVYSYGDHWPLHAYINGAWYSNESYYGPTTRGHYGQTHPGNSTNGVTLEHMRDLIRMALTPQPVAQDTIAPMRPQPRAATLELNGVRVGGYIQFNDRAASDWVGVVGRVTGIDSAGFVSFTVTESPAGGPHIGEEGCSRGTHFGACATYETSEAALLFT